MAKQIKVIKCPNCGSIEKTEIKPEHYRCENCNTEYFLDSDDINVNVKYHNHNQNSTQTNYLDEANIKSIIIIVACIVVAIVFGSLISIFFKSKSYSNNSYSNPPVTHTTKSTKSDTTLPAETKNSVKDVNYHYCSLTLVENKPFIISIAQRKYSQSSQSKYFFVVHDLLANKIVQESEIADLKMDNFGNVKWDSHDFTQDKTYLTAGKRSAFLLDKKKLTLTEVTSSLLENYPQYNTGIASINITTAQSTRGARVFHILTDDGQKIYYFPIQDKAYVDNNDFYMALKNFDQVNDSSEHTAFSFAQRYDKDFKLIKFTYVSPDGKSYYTFTSADVGDERTDGSGKFTDEASAYNIDNTFYRNSKYRLVSHQNLTPNRLYFSPEIVYFDDTSLIIKTKASASPDSHYNYQRLDTNTGKVLWTLSEDKIRIKEVTHLNDNFIAKQNCDKYAIISSDGTISKEITLTQEK